MISRCCNSSIEAKETHYVCNSCGKPCSARSPSYGDSWVGCNDEHVPFNGTRSVSEYFDSLWRSAE